MSLGSLISSFQFFPNVLQLFDVKKRKNISITIYINAKCDQKPFEISDVYDHKLHIRTKQVVCGLLHKTRAVARTLTGEGGRVGIHILLDRILM